MNRRRNLHRAGSAEEFVHRLQKFLRRVGLLRRNPHRAIATHRSRALALARGGDDLHVGFSFFSARVKATPSMYGITTSVSTAAIAPLRCA
jgi:hypothetical protein